MKWIAISGSWRKINREVEKDVRNTAMEIISKEDGILSGGALGVDYVATTKALKLDPATQKIRIFLPTTLEIYTHHYRKRVKEGVISKQQAEDLISQLSKIKDINPLALIENETNKIVNEKTYHQRNSEIIKTADKLIAFHVNESPGVKDAINKARKKGIPVKVFAYTID